MNELNLPDFFPDPDPRSVAPDIDEPDRETEVDRRHQQLLAEFEAKISERSGIALAEEPGELPFDEESDLRRWNKLEKEFDCLFNDAELIISY